VSPRRPKEPRPHWSEVLGDVADLGARTDEVRRESITAAAEGSTTGFIGGPATFTIGDPPPRKIRKRVTEPRPAPDVLDAPTVRIALPSAPTAPPEPSTAPQIGPPPPRMPAGGRDVPAPPLGPAPAAAPAPETDAASAPPSSEPPAPPAAPAGGGGRRLLKDNLVVAAGTALSRVTGVARLLAVYLLSQRLADAYLLANNTPNIVYELILGGILTATLVPLFTQHLEHDDEEATNVVVSVTLVALAALTLIAFVIAPLLILFYGQNVDGSDRDQFLRVGIYLSVLFVPQVFFYGCMAVGSALLNARRRFFAAAWAPVLNNVVVVAVLAVAGTSGQGKLGLDDVDSSTGLLVLLGLGTTSGIAAMAISLLPALRRSGVRIRFRPRFRHPAVRAAAGLSGWTLGYVIANQVAAQTVLFLAVDDPGTVRSYQVGFIFFQLPHGLLAVSLMTTFQPDLARSFVQRAWATFHGRLLQGLRLLVAVMVPAAVGYLTLAVLVVQRGPDAEWFRPERGLGEAVPVAQALAGFAPGLLGFSVYLFVLRAFYATQDTKRPFWINAVENLVNIVMAILLIIPFSLIGGLTAAYSIAYLAAAALALAVLLRRLPPGFDLRGFVATLGRCLVAAALMAAAVAVLVLALTAVDPDLLAVGLALGVVVGAVVYVVTALLLGVVRDAGMAGRLPGPLGRLSPGVHSPA